MLKVQLSSASLSSISRESAYIHKFPALCPLLPFFATSYAFSVIQVDYFGRAKCCAVHCDALFASLDTPFTILFPRLRRPVKRDSEGSHILLRCRHTSVQLQGIPLPQVNIPVDPTCLSRDILCRFMETFDSSRSLRHPELPPIRRHQ